MILKLLLIAGFMVACPCAALSQNSNSSTTTPTKPRTATTKPTPASQSTKTTTPAPAKTATPSQPTDAVKPKAPAPVAKTTTPKPAVTAAAAPGSGAVQNSFNKLLDGIRHANVNEVTSVYWNSPRLALFNNNGTVTKGWDQLRKNRESSYPDLKDVKLDVRDVSVTMLGRDGAVVTCLWTQSQTYKGTPESATGRMTLVYKRIGNDWKIIHLHTSPDKEEPSRVMPSEQTPAAKPSPTP
jgi:ketosteroid isomerase-like protein